MTLTLILTRTLPTVAGVVLLELAREVLGVECGAVVAVRPLVLVEDRVGTRAVAHLRAVGLGLGLGLRLGLGLGLGLG